MRIRTNPNRVWNLQQFTRRIFKLTTALLLSCLTACTTLPTREFATYKETFAKARAAGQDILLDYGKAKAQYDELRAQSQSQDSASRPGESKRPSPLDLAKQAAAPPMDEVAVRFQAWDVVARYNDALTALAEGRSAQAVATSVKGLVQSLNSFPVDTIAELGGKLIPVLGPLTALFEEGERERSRQEFLSVLSQCAPIIREQFIGLLKNDAANFSNIRYGLNNIEYSNSIFKIVAAKKRFESLAGVYQPSNEIAGIVTEINITVGRLPRSPRGISTVDELKLGATPAGATGAPLSVLEQLQALKAEIGDLVAQALETNSRWVAYGQTLVAYVGLLDQTSRSLQALEQAARNPGTVTLPGTELLKAVITLRQAFLAYNSKG